MRLNLIVAIVLATVAPAAAQDRPFLLSVATASETKSAVRFDYDVGVGERAFQSDISNQPEQRVGLHASHGRLTLFARFGLASPIGETPSDIVRSPILRRPSGRSEDIVERGSCLGFAYFSLV